MIPIIFEKTETAFTSSGIGRLVDCIECLVTEELNTGVYECDFQYPVTGELFSEIQLGRIVGVTHDDTGDLQPFDIVSCSRPIDGVVSFHAVHVSYRLARYVCIPDPNNPVDTFSKVLTFFDNAYPWLSAGRFDFKGTPGETTPTGYLAAAADGIPRSVRDYIGGVDGCYLDTFGGEVIWNKFDVQFTAHRGTVQDFQIRYGVNMMDYNEEQDGQETYTLAIPFWKGQGNLVVGGLVDSGLTPYDRQLCVAMDLTDKFETEPTAAQLEAEALSIMTSGQPNLPKRTIEVDFVRLQDLEDYVDYSDLATCELGDSITVVFPMYNITGTFRIVKVIWDVLRDRFDTMTLGSLQTTLAEALGVTGGMTNVGGGGGGGSVVSFTQVLSSGTKIGIITIDGTSTDIYAPTGGGGGGVFYGTCGTAAATAAKAVTCPSFTAADLTAGTVLYVDFTYSNTVASPTLNVNSTGAKDIMRYGTTRPSTSAASSWNAGSIVCMVYDGTYWNIAGWLNTTYSAISQTNIENQSGTSTGLITGQRFTQGLAARLAISQTLASGTEIAEITLNGTATKLYAPSSGLQNTFYGTSSTAAATAAKDVVCSDWLDNYGDIIAVTFTNANTAQSPQLAVNGGTARPIFLNGNTSGATWEAGETVTFMRRAYGGGTPCFECLSNGNAYDLASSKSTVSYTPTQTSGTAIGTLTIDNVANTLYAPSSGGSRSDWYATSTSSATNTLTASTTSHDFSLTAGNVVHVLFSNEPNNSTNPFTLNVDGTGAKTIYGSGGQSSTVTKAWAANEVVSFVYSGTYFQIIDAGRATTSNYGETILSSLHNSSAEDVAATSKAVKDAYDLANGKSTVSWSQSQSSGTKIATVTIDGTPTDVYAPSGGGGGSYTATAPIDITNNVISHETSGVTAGTYDGGWVKGTGFYLPSFTVDAKGHVTAASDLGQAIPVIASGVSTESAFLLYGHQYNYLPRAASNYGNEYLLSAGNTTATFTLYDYASISPYYMRVVSVEAVDTTTGEKVLVDWTTSYPISTAGKTNSIVLSVSIANAYTHNIAIIPMVGYATAGM